MKRSMGVFAAVASVAALLVVAGPAEAAPADSAKVVRPKLRLSAPASRTVTVNKTVKIKVTVKNRSRVKARRTVVRIAAPAGVRVSKKKLKLGTLRPGAKRTRTVRVRLKAPARKVVRIKVGAGKAKKVTRKLVLKPAATRWKGNFATPTDKGITFKVSGNRRAITSFQAVQVTAYCYYGGFVVPYYPTVSIARIPVASNGTFNTSVKVPATPADEFPKTIKVSGRIVGGKISNGQLALSARYEGTQPVTTCGLYDSAKTWTAAVR